MQFVSIATPHLGVYETGLFRHLLPVILSRSGQQICLKDDYISGIPLLKCMALPSLPWFQGLALFERIISYANIVNDRSVGYESAAITRENKFLVYDSQAVHEQYPEIRILDLSSPLPNGLSLPPLPLLRFIFFALLPIIVPIALTRFAYMTSKSSYRLKEADTSIEWVRGKESVNFLKDKSLPSSTLNQDDLALDHAEHLNNLPWIKIHVLVFILLNL